ncbi:MAG TPA: hypothetical protein VFL84_08635 [Gammaproteobacteria bacterium]|nr:hypothetical protein [Gammaproteobacteria bacterium]
MTHRALAIVSAAAFLGGVADEAAFSQERPACARGDLACWQQLHTSQCAHATATLETCLVFLQRLETARKGAYSTGIALLLGETLADAASKDASPQSHERFLQRARAAYREVVKNEPFNASGYLGLAEIAATGAERVEWLRGAVRAEYQPAHMELLATALLQDGGQPPELKASRELEAARVIEDAYTYESTSSERWRYSVLGLRRYTEAVERYPSAVTERAVDNVVLRVKDDIDYALLQRMLLMPESYLPYLADAFATMCEKSIAVLVTLDECMDGLELAVSTAESSFSAGTRRLLAEATLTGMRTVAGESLPRSAQARGKFIDWIDRLLATELEPVDVAVDLLEARADYTPNLLERADTLQSALELLPNRGDLRLKLGATYVSLWLWPEALEQLRVAKFYLPIDEQQSADTLIETADRRYQATFFPSAPSEQ